MKNEIIQWNPMQELENFQRKFAALWGGEPFPAGEKSETLTLAAWSPRVDIAEGDKEYVLKAELPEIKRDDLNVTVDDGVLTISGERKFEKEEKKRKFHRVEREYGSFTRSFALPGGVAGDKVDAVFKEGILTVKIPKQEQQSAKSVQVKIN